MHGIVIAHCTHLFHGITGETSEKATVLQQVGVGNSFVELHILVRVLFYIVSPDLEENIQRHI